MSLLFFQLVPPGVRKFFYGLIALAAVAFAFWVQTRRVESLKADNASLTASLAASGATVGKLKTAYAAADKTVGAYVSQKDETQKTQILWKEKIVYVDKTDPLAHEVLDTLLPPDVVSSMCDPLPSACGAPDPSPPVKADGAGPAAAATYPRLTVRDLVNNRSDLLAWGLDCRSRHNELSEFISETVQDDEKK